MKRRTTILEDFPLSAKEGTTLKRDKSPLFGTLTLLLSKGVGSNPGVLLLLSLSLGVEDYSD